MKSLFSLSRPGKQHDRLLEESLRPKLLRQWVDGLPTANSARMAQDIIRQLGIMNRMEMNGEERLAGLEMIRPCYLSLLGQLEGIPDTGFPLETGDQALLMQLTDLVRSFATAYWIAVEELEGSSGKGLLSSGKSQILALQRLMRGLYDLYLLACYQHQPRPDWMWMDLGMLLGMAEKTGKAGSGFRSSGNHPADRLSCHAVYKQILLLSLSHTDGMMQHELLHFSALLPGWVEFMELHKEFPGRASTVYLIHTGEDTVPVRCTMPSGNGDRVKYLECDRLLGKLLPRLRKASHNRPRFELSFSEQRPEMELVPELLDYLEASWRDGSPPAGDILFEDRAPRFLALGLKAIHDQFDPALAAQSQKVVETASDHSLVLEKGFQEQASVGSLVAFARQDREPRSYALGRICRISNGKIGGTLVVELKQIASPVMSAGIQPLSQDAGNTRVYQRALIYNEVLGESGQQRSNLVLATQKLRNGNKIRLLAPTGPYTVLLDNQRSIALGYMAFNCRKAED